MVIRVVDLDNDGDPDILSAWRFHECSAHSCVSRGSIRWFENRVDEGLDVEEHEIVEDTLVFDSIVSSDFDGDGHADVVAGQGQTLRFYRNSGRASVFEQGDSLASSGVVQELAVADIDGDGSIDLIVALRTLQQSGSDTRFVWHKNESASSTFGYEHLIAVTDGHVDWMLTSDVNGDSKPDILAGFYEGRKSVWWNNQDGQSFSEAQDVSEFLLSDGTVRIVDGDIDGDQDRDIVVASSSRVLGDPHHQDRIAWYENIDSRGSFLEHLITESTKGVSGVALTDIDMDSDLDLIAASWSDGNLVWFENLDGEGAYSEPKMIWSQVDCAIDLVTGDIDGDSDADIILSTGPMCGIFTIERMDSSRILWFNNQNPTTSAEGAVEIPGLKVVAYPNPAKDRVTFRHTGFRSGPTSLALYDSQGRQLDDVRLITAGPEILNLDTRSLQSGTYFYRITSGGRVHYQPFVVLR